LSGRCQDFKRSFKVFVSYALFYRLAINTGAIIAWPSFCAKTFSIIQQNGIYFVIALLPKWVKIHELVKKISLFEPPKI
jgi:hypothetical protein